MANKNILLEQLKNFGQSNIYNNGQIEIIEKMINSKDLSDKDKTSLYNLMARSVEVGFVFDEDSTVDRSRQNILTYLKKDEKISFKNEGTENQLIIGDNYDALSNLMLTHKDLIDVIYIDPPYNTEEIQSYKDKFSKNC